MPEKVVEVLIEGGKATAAPPLGPALGPLGVNIGNVVGEINSKTKSFSGMQVPVKVIVDTDTKEFRIEVGTPPTTSLIKKELNLEKGAQKPGEEVVGNITTEQLKKIVEMKAGSLQGNTIEDNIRTIAGTAQSMGLTIDGMKPKEYFEKNGKKDRYI